MYSKSRKDWERQRKRPRSWRRGRKGRGGRTGSQGAPAPRSVGGWARVPFYVTVSTILWRSWCATLAHHGSAHASSARPRHRVDPPLVYVSRCTPCTFHCSSPFRECWYAPALAAQYRGSALSQYKDTDILTSVSQSIAGGGGRRSDTEQLSKLIPR